MPTVRIQEKNYSESIMVLKLKDGPKEKQRMSFCRGTTIFAPILQPD